MAPSRFAVVVLLTAGIGGVISSRAAFQGEHGRAIPPPVLDEPAGAGAGVATLAGGCFWGVQGVFQHVNGVTSAVSGYAGGDRAQAAYDRVVTGRTGHAESVQIVFDPKKISYGQVLQIFFSVAHNPTHLNRQGPDIGTQYRSAVFPSTPDQARIAAAYIDQLNATKIFAAKIATTIELNREFYAAEPYHQDYLTRHPNEPYIVYNDLPKIGELKRLFPDRYRATPVLVGGR
jgi:peptide-methionine (S)-S-oxide reductase